MRWLPLFCAPHHVFRHQRSVASLAANSACWRYPALSNSLSPIQQSQCRRGVRADRRYWCIIDSALGHHLINERDRYRLPVYWWILTLGPLLAGSDQRSALSALCAGRSVCHRQCVAYFRCCCVDAGWHRFLPSCTNRVRLSARLSSRSVRSGRFALYAFHIISSVYVVAVIPIPCLGLDIVYLAGAEITVLSGIQN